MISTHKMCGNCGKRSHCGYKGIISPCDEWRPDSEQRQLQSIAMVLATSSKPMNAVERQIVASCMLRDVITERQATVLRQINVR